MLRSRAAATSAPAKFGIRPCGGNGKRATPSALSLSQTHCRAALLSAKSRAMTESGAARPGDSQGRNLLHEKPWGDPRLAHGKLPVRRLTGTRIETSMGDFYVAHANKFAPSQGRGLKHLPGKEIEPILTV